MSRSKRPSSRGSTGNLQQAGFSASWKNYSAGDIGEFTILCMSVCRGVLLSTTPSGDLLTARLYHEVGHTPLYGRSIGELRGRLFKLFGSITTPSKSPITAVKSLTSEPAYGSIEYMVDVVGWTLEQATAFDAYLAPTRVKRSLPSQMGTQGRVFRLSPPPL